MSEKRGGRRRNARLITAAAFLHSSVLLYLQSCVLDLLSSKLMCRRSSPRESTTIRLLISKYVPPLSSLYDDDAVVIVEQLEKMADWRRQLDKSHQSLLFLSPYFFLFPLSIVKVASKCHHLSADGKKSHDVDGSDIAPTIR